MVAKKIISQKAITNSEANEYLKDIESEFAKKEKELPFEIQQTKEYLSKVNKTSKKDEKDLTKKLNDLGLPEIAVIELLNSMPKSEEIIKTILYKKLEFSDDLVKQIKEILS